MVHGVLCRNVALGVADPAVTDVPVTIRSLLGVDAPAYMRGRDLTGDALP